jgi:hypothetical protein
VLAWEAVGVERTGERATALARAMQLLGQADSTPGEVLAELWDEAFEQGRLSALDELSGRFCVCMK